MSAPDPPPPRSAVETAFPFRRVTRLAATEAYNKHHYRPTNYAHKWWARRLGSVVRAVCIAALADPGASADDLWDRQTASNDFDDPLVLDPFVGGGTTGQEATRLGARFVGVDCNPVAWFVARMSLAPPPEELDRAFEAVVDAARPEVRPYFRTTCPDCGAGAPAAFYLWVERTEGPDGPVRRHESLVVDHDRDGGATVVCPACAALSAVEAAGDAVCRACGEAFDATRGARVPAPGGVAPFGGGDRPAYVPYAVKCDCDDCGPGFGAVDAADARVLRAARDRIAAREDLPLPTAAIPDGVKTRTLRASGYDRWTDLFSARQRLAFGALVAAVRDLDRPAARRYLALVVSSALEFNSMFCSYKGADPRGPGAVRHTFSHHAFVHPDEPLENNPLGTRPGQSGTLALRYRRLRRALAFQERPVERVLGPDGRVAEKRPVPGERIGGDPAPSVAALAAGEGTHHVRHGDAAALSLPDGVAADAVVTDPPYYDSVQYAELSAFFHAWQRALLADEFPAVFGDDGVSSAAEAVGNRHRGRSLDDYARLLGRALQAATAAAADDAPVAFTFHHGDAAAWGALLEALDAADLRVVATYPVRGESSRSVHVAGQRAVRLDSVVVCRTRRGRAPGAWSDVLARTEREARGRLRDLRDVEEVSRPDASVVVRGAALVAYSAHGEVRDRDGPVGPREALARVETVTDRLNEP